MAFPFTKSFTRCISRNLPALLFVIPLHNSTKTSVEVWSHLQDATVSCPGQDDGTTVDGRNPAPDDTVGSLSHYSQGSLYPRWCRISSMNSMVSPADLGKKWLLQMAMEKNNSIKLSIGLNSKLVRDMFNTVSLSYG